MNKKILFSVLIIGMSLNVFSQSNLAEVNKINGFYVFIDSSPLEEYEVVGEIKVENDDKEIIRSGGQYLATRDNIIKNARLANYSADGLIFTFIDGGTDKASMIKFKQNSPKNNIAKVQQFQGIYLFTDSTPISGYDYIDSVKFSGGFSSGQYTNVRETLLKRTKKRYSEAKGLMLKLVVGSDDVGDAIKFK
jgi:hypothetical protein